MISGIGYLPYWEDNGISYFLRFGRPSERDMRFQSGYVKLAFFGYPVHEIFFHIAWGYSIYIDIISGPSATQDSGHLHHPSLSAIIQHPFRKSDYTIYRSDVNDLTASLFPHFPSGGLVDYYA